MKKLYRQLAWLLLPGGLFLGLSAQIMAAPTAQEATDIRHETQISTSYALNPLLRDQDIRVTVYNNKATLNGTVEESVKKELAQEIAVGVEGISSVDNQLEVRAGFMPPPPTLTRGYGEMADDATLNASVKSRLQWSRYADELDVTVSSHLGRVTLQGSASSQKSHDMAAIIASSTRGVNNVDNQLQVTPPPSGMASAAKRSSTQVEQGLSDTWITTKVKSTLLYSRNIESSSISVSTSHGVVSLSGQLHGQAERALAIQLSKNVRGVQRVEAGQLRP
jgi:osmotically-inducible protein OsmY